MELCDTYLKAIAGNSQSQGSVSCASIFKSRKFNILSQELLDYYYKL